MNKQEVTEVFDQALAAIEKRAPLVNLVVLPHPDPQMQDMDMICVQVYLEHPGTKEPTLFCQQIMDKALLEARFGGVPATWPKLSKTRLDNQLP